MTFYRLCAQSQTSDIDAYDRYINATGAILDSDTGLLRIPKCQSTNLRSLYFKIADRLFELIANAQIFPLSTIMPMGGSPEFAYLTVGTLGTRTSFPPCMLGSTFLERYYTVFDASNQSIGLATTQLTYLKIEYSNIG